MKEVLHIIVTLSFTNLNIKFEHEVKDVSYFMSVMLQKYNKSSSNPE